MKRAWNVLLGLAVFSPLLLTVSSSKVCGIADETIVSRTGEIDGVKRIT